MSRQIAPYRSYCPVCANYRILHRYLARYFCSSCLRRIARAFRADASTSVDAVVETIQRESTGERITRWQVESEAKRWRRAPGKH